MLLKNSHGNEIFPYAAIPHGHCPKGGGILICSSRYGAGRVAYSVEELYETNPKEIVDGIVENLQEDFYSWCDSQQRKFDDRKEFQPNKLAFNASSFYASPMDIMKESDYLEYESCAVCKCFRKGLK
jgi:hypothetical protein